MSKNTEKHLSGTDAVDLDNPSVIGFFEESIRKNWDNSAVTDYQGESFLYKEVAQHIEKLHIVFEGMGLQPGDRVALCGKNCKNWGVAFLSVFTYGAVPVPILADFTPEYIHNIVNHSEAKLLFAGESNWSGLDFSAMPAIQGAILTGDYSLAQSRSEALSEIFSKADAIYAEKFPEGLKPENLSYFKESNPDALAILNYTSGTTSQPKGVMIPYRAVRCNIKFAVRKLPMKPGSRTVSMLPLAHMFGLMFEFLFDIVLGCHIHFLTRIPSPQIIFKAFAEFKPNLIITVPLVIEKVVKSAVLPIMNKPAMKLAMSIPGLRTFIGNKIRTKLADAFGGDLLEVVIGGAALNPEVENCLRKIHFPFSVGYGSTECAPLISYVRWYEYAPTSCGRAITDVEVKILSNDPENVPGEIIIHGDNVMLGYFRNEEATAKAIDKDGWFYSGDLGTMDKEGNIYIKGRSKTMILGPSGQNIYPEELEARINNAPYIAESLVVERSGKLTALVVLNNEALKADSVQEADIEKIMEQNRQNINAKLPVYEKINSFQTVDGFEKTPKGSIKRFLYKDK